MNRRILPGLLGLMALSLTGCADELPTAIDEDFLPIQVRTVEVILPWDQFGHSLVVYGGYGTPLELGQAVVARSFEGTLDARALVRFRPFPQEATVRDSLGTSRSDSTLTFVGGRIVARIDTSSAVVDGPVVFSAHRLQQEWDPRSASWVVAVDTAGNRQLWPQPGAEPSIPAGTTTWTPGDSIQGDSIVIEVDSATVAEWGDTTNLARGLRLDAETEGVRVAINSVNLRLTARPSIHQDTLITVSAGPLATTFIYSPIPEAPAQGIRVGGVPAWRSVIRMDLPPVLNGPASLCALVGCPFVLEPDRINAAVLVLRTRTTDPAFQPSDTVRLDARAVLAPERLPKSPLAAPFLAGGFGQAVPPSAFGEGAGEEVALIITPFVRDLARDTTATGAPAPDHLALLSLFEPLSISYASFAGPGQQGEPYLRMIVTTADTVQVR